jgi:hypothetical protein
MIENQITKNRITIDRQRIHSAPLLTGFDRGIVATTDMVMWRSGWLCRLITRFPIVVPPIKIIFVFGGEDLRLQLLSILEHINFYCGREPSPQPVSMRKTDVTASAKGNLAATRVFKML